MALINNIYVLAQDEDVEKEVQTTTHPTESGVPTSDSVKPKPIVIRISGVIADNKIKAEDAIKKLFALQADGSQIKYIGACGTFSNMQIQSFVPSYTHKVHGGAKFEMTLQEFRTAKTSYVKQQATKVETTGTFAVDEYVLFNGGYVYVASDATKPASKRGQSECRLTKISSLAGATHIYHLISRDGKGVYGWVDASNVSALGKKVASSSSAGTQQVQTTATKSNTSKKTAYYTVKKGDTVYRLVTDAYGSYGMSVAEFVKKNEKAFSVKGNVTTLKVGSRVAIVK